MKKQIIPACVQFFLALLLAIGSQSFLGPCVHEDGGFGACHWAGRAMLGLGGLSALLAALALILKGERPGLYLASALNAILGIAIPGTLIDLCGMDAMRCRMVMKPAMLVLCVLMLAASLAGWLLSRGRARG